MPIPLRNLDCASWTELVDESRSLIPLLAPEWTDHNASDPGITLLELFAWLAEMDLYSLNRITPQHRLRFLELLGIRPEAPQPARAVLEAGLNTVDPFVALPQGLRFAGVDASGAMVPFRLLEPATVVRAGVAAGPVAGARLPFEFEVDSPLPVGQNISLYLRFRPSGAQWTGDPLAPHHSARVQWEYRSASGWHPIEAEDRTRACTQSGMVRLAMSVPARRIRCRLAAGEFDAEPVLERAVWNALEVEQSKAIAAVPIGEGSAEPGQRLQLPERPVIESSVRLWTIENGVERQWSRRDSFVASRRADAHYTLDSTSGAIRFGDGERGRTAPFEAPVHAEYFSTLGAGGNAAAGAITTLSDPALADSVSVRNPDAAEGGAAAETLSHALGRAISIREERLRAVTLGDFEALALSTPGTSIARAAARANLHPDLECANAPGVVTVLIVPANESKRPSPSAGLRTAVARRLEARRVVGTRVVVAAPRYTEVAVKVRVKAMPRASRTAVRDRVQAALDEFLHPLRGGPARTGWPFGRDVYRSEVMQAVDETEGVDHVLSLELSADGGAPQCGNLCVRPTWLVCSGRHEIEVE